jgi:hypothetical protein
MAAEPATIGDTQLVDAIARRATRDGELDRGPEHENPRGCGFSKWS